MKNRRDFLKTIGAGSLLISFPGLNISCSRYGRKKRPNIIFIMSDDHAYQAIGCYGSRINSTPNIDRLARDGVRFVQSFCTNSICAPSRAVMLTGKYSHINGVINNSVKFEQDQQTFPMLLQKSGYQTALFGKWHLKSTPRGFDYWKILQGQGHYYNPDFIEMGERKRCSGYVTDLITDDCLKWLKNRKSKKPFCVLLHHKAPHRNWMPGPNHLHLYEDRKIPLPDTFFDDYRTRSDAARQQEMRVADNLFMAYDLKVTPEKKNTPLTDKEKIDISYWNSVYGRMNESQRSAWDAAYGPRNRLFRMAGLRGTDLQIWMYQRYIKDYLRCVASVDDNIGRVLDYLDESGLRDDTVVIYTSDQGFYLGEHGWFDKRFMYEESLRIPLIIRYPCEVEPGVNEKDMVLNLDFAPTILDFAGVKIPDDIQGESIRSILRGETPANWRQSIYYHYFEYPAVHSVKRHYGIRTHRYKLIHFYFDIDAWELYDLEKDPQELHNLYNDKRYSGVVEKLKEELNRLREKYKDTDEKRFLPAPFRKIKHKAVGCSVRCRSCYSRRYSAGGDGALTDGVCAPDKLIPPLDYRVWQGYEGVDLDVEIDLGRVESVKEISTGFLHNINDWIFQPLSVTYEVSVLTSSRFIKY